MQHFLQKRNSCIYCKTWITTRKLLSFRVSATESPNVSLWFSSKLTHYEAIWIMKGIAHFVTDAKVMYRLISRMIDTFAPARRVSERHLVSLLIYTSQKEDLEKRNTLLQQNIYPIFHQFSTAGKFIRKVSLYTQLWIAHMSAATD